LTKQPARQVHPQQRSRANQLPAFELPGGVDANVFWSQRRLIHGRRAIFGPGQNGQDCDPEDVDQDLHPDRVGDLEQNKVGSK
jgi:hypothetical protein